MAKPKAPKLSPLEKLHAKNLDVRQWAQRAQVDGGLISKMDSAGKVKPGDIKTLNRKLEIMTDQSIRGGGRPSSRYRGGGWLGSTEEIPNDMMRRLATRPSQNMTFFDDVVARQKVHNNLVKAGKAGTENAMDQMKMVDMDHDIPIKAKSKGVRVATGLNVPDNLSLLDADYNRSVKSNKLPDEFIENTYKSSKGSDRLDGYRNGKRVPKYQGGFTTMLTDPKVYKALGKVGLIGGATAALEYFDPDNPLAQARQRGYALTDQIGGLLGMNGIKGGIENMKPGLNKTIASIGDSMLLDPVVSALGAGANMGDRMYNEWRGTNKKANLKRTGTGLGGRGIIHGY